MADDGSATSQIQHVEVENGTYDGETRDGVPHGRGMKTDVKGSTYEGEWKEGKKHG